MLLWDPSVLVGVLSQHTEHLGFVFTNSILQDHPFTFARRASTLDHLTEGRIGWNIVTSYSPNAARNFGMDDLPPRDERYAWAQEYADATYALWEGSWEEDALVRDAARAMFIDPDKVHTVDHVGRRYRIQGPHMTSPTVQRTPLLLQAGGSPAGRAFAARNAELQFLALGSEEQIAADIADVRRLSATAGRRPGDLKFILEVSFVVGSTEHEARRMATELGKFADDDDMISDMSTSIGVDLSRFGPDTPVSVILQHATSGGMTGVRDAMIARLPKDRPATLRDLMDLRGTVGHVVGTPEQIVEQIQRWQDIGVGGITVGMTRRPGSFFDFVDQVTPLLQERGLAQREYSPGSLRSKVMGYGDRLPPTHPAARFRRS